MVFKIELSPVAIKEINKDFEWLYIRNPEAAQSCYTSLFRAFDTLKTFPKRCSLAPENDAFEEEIRLLVHQFSKSRKYRILFMERRSFFNRPLITSQKSRTE